MLRDVDEDLAHGRVYLAAETLDRLGVADLARDDRTALLREGAGRAERWYQVGMAGIPDLRRGRRGVLAAALLYREILRPPADAGTARSGGSRREAPGEPRSQGRSPAGVRSGARMVPSVPGDVWRPDRAVRAPSKLLR